MSSTGPVATPRTKRIQEPEQIPTTKWYSKQYYWHLKRNGKIAPLTKTERELRRNIKFDPISQAERGHYETFGYLP